MTEINEEGLRTTPLTAHHLALEARMVPFAGYSMPVQYPAGIIKEHQSVREGAGLFDVSHMGQAYLMGHEAAAGLERLVPGDIQGLKIGQMRYTVLLNEQGGVIDDLMVLKLGNDLLYIVVNASRKDVDYGVLRRGLPRDVTLEILPERALVALQGPKAEAILSQYHPRVKELGFMQGFKTEDGTIITRSGYTGEDGFEISQPTDEGLGIIAQLNQHEGLGWVGLGARDSLRMEAGLCLYGHEPLLSVVLISLIDGVAMIPTIRKSIQDPHGENLLSYVIANIKGIMALLALANFTLITSLYVISIFIVNSVLIAVCLYGRRRKPALNKGT